MPLFILAGAHARAEVLAVRTIGLTLSDLDRTERFYRDTLDFRTVARKHLQDPALDALFGLPTEEMDVLTMQLGDQQVEFTRFERPGRPYPAGSRSPDLWFQHFAIVVSDMHAAYARLRAAGVPPISYGGLATTAGAERRRACLQVSRSGRPSAGVVLVPARTRTGKSGSSGPACFWASTTVPSP